MAGGTSIRRSSSITPNYRRLKRAGLPDLIRSQAAGSFREDGSLLFVLADQLIDRTMRREKSFFGSGFVAHVSMARPVLSRLVPQRSREGGSGGGENIAARPAGVSRDGRSAISSWRIQPLLGSWECDVIGHDGDGQSQDGPRAELPYYAIGAMVTDFDYGSRHDGRPVTVDQVIGC